MGTKRKIKIRKNSSKAKVMVAKPSHLTDAQWDRLTSDEPLFPEKLKKVTEILERTKRKFF